MWSRNACTRAVGAFLHPVPVLCDKSRMRVCLFRVFFLSRSCAARFGHRSRVQDMLNGEFALVAEELHTHIPHTNTATPVVGMHACILNWQGTVGSVRTTLFDAATTASRILSACISGASDMKETCTQRQLWGTGWNSGASPAYHERINCNVRVL